MLGGGDQVAALEPVGELPSEAQAPLPDRLVLDLDAERRQDQLDLPQAQTEALVQPYGLVDDLGREAEAAVGGRGVLVSANTPRESRSRQPDGTLMQLWPFRSPLCGMVRRGAPFGGTSHRRWRRPSSSHAHDTPDACRLPPRRGLRQPLGLRHRGAHPQHVISERLRHSAVRTTVCCRQPARLGMVTAGYPPVLTCPVSPGSPLRRAPPDDAFGPRRFAVTCPLQRLQR